MRIAAVTMVYNEALLLPYFLKHYEHLDGIIVLYEKDSNDGTLDILRKASNVSVVPCHIEGQLDDLDKTALINDMLHSTVADWVYILDCDEFIAAPAEPDKDFLARQDSGGYSVVRVGMFQVYRHRNDKNLDANMPIIQQRMHGDRDLFSTVEGENRDCNAYYVKPIVLKPSKEISLGMGNHTVVGEVKISPELYVGAHWQMADPVVAITRRLSNRARLSERNRENNRGWQHSGVTEQWIRDECEQHLDDPLIGELALVGKNSSLSNNLMIMGLRYRTLEFDYAREIEEVEKLKRKAVLAECRANELAKQLRQVQNNIPMTLARYYDRLLNRVLKDGSFGRRYYNGLLGKVRRLLIK